MKRGPYQVEFLTWNTHAGVGEGLGTGFDAKHLGGNFGHASVAISMPYSPKTEGWLDQYCRKIKLYQPQNEAARTWGEVYEVDVPVHYTTQSGQRIFDPALYSKEHPDEEIVTHVYLSWVPGPYAAQRDERDPFLMGWKRGFELYTAEQDRNIEYVGHGVEYKRGSTGRREIEFQDGTMEGTGKYITRGANKVLHNLTEDELKYYSLTPAEKQKIKESEDEKPPYFIEQEKIENFLNIAQNLETNHAQVLQEFNLNINLIVENIIVFYNSDECKVIDDIYDKFPVFEIFLNNYYLSEIEDGFLSNEQLTAYIESGFKSSFNEYMTLRPKILDRLGREAEGLSVDGRVILPIANIDGLYDRGHADGLNVEAMLRSIPEFVANGEGYALQYNNCSDFANSFGYAGAPEHLKHEFKRAALGWFTIPQIVSNSAQQYANIIYDIQHQPGVYQLSVTKKSYLDLESKVSKISKRYEDLNTKIGFQNGIVENFIERIEEEYFETHDDAQVLQSMLKDLLMNHTLESLKKMKPAALRSAIYEYADKKIVSNIDEDKLKIHPMIQEQNGLFDELKSRMPEALTDKAIKLKMKELYVLEYGNKPFWGKAGQLDKDFNDKGSLYLRACHTILFENAKGVDNLSDPNFISMAHERTERDALKTKLFGGIFTLLRMRMAANIFKDSYNIDDPWFELKWGASQTRTLIDTYVGVEPSLIRTAANVVRGVYLGYAAVRQGTLIAPRRYISLGLQGFRNMFITKSGIQKASKQEQGIDIAFALESGKITIEQLVKEQMTKEYIKGLSTFSLMFRSSKSIQAEIDAQFLNKDSELFKSAALKIKSDLPENIEDRIKRSKIKTDEFDKRQKLLSEQAVEVAAKDLSEGLLKFEQNLNEGKIPYFEKSLSDKMLSKTKQAINCIQAMDQALEKNLGHNLVESLNQFQKMSMIVLGEKEDDKWMELDVYNGGSVIPQNIMDAKDPIEVREFLIEILIKMKEKDLEMSVLKDFNAEKINKISNDDLKMVIEYLGQPSMIEQFNQFSKKLSNFKASDYSPFKDKQVNFESFLIKQGLNPKIIKKMKSEGEFENLYLKISTDMLMRVASNNLLEIQRKDVSTLHEILIGGEGDDEADVADSLVLQKPASILRILSQQRANASQVSSKPQAQAKGSSVDKPRT